MLARIVLAAALAGLFGGAAWSAAQAVGAVPLILEAETFEAALHAASHGPASAEGHEHAGWAPADGVERTLYTLLGNVLTATGFALLLTAAMAVRGGVSWPKGLVWGLAGFVAVHLAPALGLPPELPGEAVAPLLARQGWWLGTVTATTAALGLIAFARSWPWRLLGVLLALLPHLVGAPQPDQPGGPAPPELQRAFAQASLAASAVAWAVLGTLAAFVFRRLGDAPTARRGGGRALS